MAPRYTDMSIASAEYLSREYVRETSKDTAIVAVRPGNAPTIIPRRQPKKRKASEDGLNAAPIMPNELNMTIPPSCPRHYGMGSISTYLNAAYML